MATQSNENQTTPQAAPTVKLSGKIVEVYKTDKGMHLTTIKLPSTDQYQSGGSVVINSDKSIGNKGEVVTVSCEVSGYSQKVKTQNTEFYRTNNTLKLIGD